MEQPIPTMSTFDRAVELLSAVGVQGDPAVPVEVYVNGPSHAIVVLEAAEQVAALQPDMIALGRLGELLVSCCALVGDAEVKTRCFVPSLGVGEDPATGSAAGPLTLHWHGTGWWRLGRSCRSSRESRSRDPAA